MVNLNNRLCINLPINLLTASDQANTRLAAIYEFHACIFLHKALALALSFGIGPGIIFGGVARSSTQRLNVTGNMKMRDDTMQDEKCPHRLASTLTDEKAVRWARLKELEKNDP